MYSKPYHAACLLYGSQAHHLDHLASLSILLQIPLLVTEKEIERLALTYYPKISVHYYDYRTAALEIASLYDHFFCCIPRDLFDDIFFFAEQALQKKLQTIWCPHGNSDKGKNTYFMEALQKEQYSLLYGEKMINFLKEKNAFAQLISYVEIGNYRYQYYLKEKQFYTKQLQKELGHFLTKKKKIILYAPTWKDRENSSSFFSAAPILIEKLPFSYKLLIKPHPNLFIQEPLEAEQLLLRYKDHPNVKFILDFPSVYPLLDLADIYIGDMSSIGYDFLTFQKPMYFLNQNKREEATDPGLYLYRSGISITPENYPYIYDVIKRSEEKSKIDFSAFQKQIYEETYGKDRSWEDLKKEVEELLVKSALSKIHRM